MQCPWIRPVSITLAAALAFAAVRAAAEPPAPGGSKSKEATVGIGVGGRGAYPRIFFVIPDMPAGRSGKIHKNDLIIAIGQGNETPVSTEHMNGGDAGKLIRGPKGTVVTLKVVPEGKQLADASTVSLTRGAFAELSRFGDGKFLKAGTKAPSLKARSLITGGPDFELKESGDRVVVLLFWGEWLENSFGPIDLAQRLADQFPEWADRLQFVAVSTDDDKDLSWRRFLESTRRSDDIIPVWTGPSVLKAFHIDTLPAVYVLDPQLKVVAADHWMNFPSVLKKALDALPSKSPARPGKANDAPSNPP